MTHIKCRYRKYRCGGLINGDYSEACWNQEGEKSKEDCICFEEKRPDNGAGDWPCIHIKQIDCEFEDDVDSYELELEKCGEFGGELFVNGTTIDETCIDYLEIDGRVLVEEEEEKA